jgi:GT2 family glycosyltransferase
VPMISIIIPVKNGQPWLTTQLEALRGQQAPAWELLVADNGSTDDSVQVAESFADVLPLRMIDASARPGPAAARNIAAAQARGSFLVFSDADDVVAPNWLAAWRDAAGSVEFGTGPITWIGADRLPDAAGPRDHFRIPHHMGFLPYALGANFGVRREVFERFGGFDERYRTAEDVELSWRLQLSGIACTPVPRALIAKRRRGETLPTIRQCIAYGRSDPLLFREFRGFGLMREPARATLLSYAGLLARLPVLFRETTRYAWASQLGKRIGRLVGSVEARVFVP